MAEKEERKEGELASGGALHMQYLKTTILGAVLLKNERFAWLL